MLSVTWQLCMLSTSLQQSGTVCYPVHTDSDADCTSNLTSHPCSWPDCNMVHWHCSASMQSAYRNTFISDYHSKHAVSDWVDCMTSSIDVCKSVWTCRARQPLMQQFQTHRLWRMHHQLMHRHNDKWKLMRGYVSSCGFSTAHAKYALHTDSGYPDMNVFKFK